MIKEILKQNDLNETQKIMNAIHTQAYWRNKEDENKRMLKNMDKGLKKDTKKEFKAILIEDLFNFALFVVGITPIMLLLIVLHK